MVHDQDSLIDGACCWMAVAGRFEVDQEFVVVSGQQGSRPQSRSWSWWMSQRGRILLVAGLVLVVDDSSGFRRLATRILNSWGHDVIEAGSVVEARIRMIEHRPKAALLDIGLPDGNGFDLARDLLELAPTVCVIVTSTDSDAGNELAALRVGAAAFFAKDELTSPALKLLLADV